MLHAPHRGSARRGPQLADVFRQYGDRVVYDYDLTPARLRVLRDLMRCRTAALGGHMDVCDHCGHSQPAYNSCRNRHCPTCQAPEQAAWIEARRERVLPVHHFHVVFTLPGQLRRLVEGNSRILYELLFSAASDTLFQLGEVRLGGQLGLTAVLHTWTRDLRVHPHVHCIVTGGALSRGSDPRWTMARPRFLFPIGVMRALFRGKFLARLDHARRRGALRLQDDLIDDNGWDAFLTHLHRIKWVVYCKRPFGGAQQVFTYLGQYTHRVAISSTRLMDVSPDAVVFRTRGEHVARLPPETFILRFLQHVLPHGFRKIRHYGLLAPSSVGDRLEIARGLLEAETPSAPPGARSTRSPEEIRAESRRCPVCGVGTLFREPDVLPSPLPPDLMPCDSS